MLRILKDGKPLSLKEQEKLVKNGKENVGRIFDPSRNYPKPVKHTNHPGLRPAGGEKNEPQPKTKSTDDKRASSGETKASKAKTGVS